VCHAYFPPFLLYVTSGNHSPQAAAGKVEIPLEDSAKKTEPIFRGEYYLAGGRTGCILVDYVKENYHCDIMNLNSP
jgi:hypothetical protein